MVVYGVYHNKCIDGGFSALILKRAIPGILLHAFSHSELENFDLQLRERDRVYFADICPKPEVLQKLSENGVEWVVIDHHVSIYEDVKKYKDENPFVDFGNYFYYPNKSGATACWDYFFKNEEMPEVLKYVEMGDIWSWESEEDRFVSKYFDLVTEIGNLDDYENLLENFDYEEAVSKGRVVWEKILSDVRYAAKEAVELEFGGEKPLCANAVLNASELGTYLAKKSESKIGIVYSILPEEGLIRFQVRSFEGDYAKRFAQKFGGGGHDRAAGFRMPISEFVEILERNKEGNKIEVLRFKRKDGEE